ncbi:MAG: carboxymuconolactone decarboxylase family protein [Phycisphaerales bacterium]|nr:carboxymuconolactone decarboxylase family protein [Phycisphaerales bacterium]
MINGYTLTDPANANQAQQEIFEKANKRFGFVPNIVNAFSESPVLAAAMLGLYAKFDDTLFNAVESHVVLQTINVLNECHYCVPAHSTIARNGGVDETLDDALRRNEPLADSKLETLRQFTTQMVQQRGHVSQDQFASFIKAGYTRQSALEIVLFITVKTLTNYGNHITGTDLDEAFKPLEWSPNAATV